MKDDRSSTAAEAGASAVPSPSSETLTERQRQVLLEIYAAFQTENASHATEAEQDDQAPAAAPKTPRTGTTTAGARRTTKDQS